MAIFASKSSRWEVSPLPQPPLVADESLPRRDPITGQPQEWTLDETKPDPVTDLWLRDGDEIEVPEK